MALRWCGAEGIQARFRTTVLPVFIGLGTRRFPSGICARCERRRYTRPMTNSLSHSYTHTYSLQTTTTATTISISLNGIISFTSSPRNTIGCNFCSRGEPTSSAFVQVCHRSPPALFWMHCTCSLYSPTVTLWSGS